MADVLLDACCLINICATGRCPEILAAVPNRWHVCTAVARETLSIYAPDHGKLTRSHVDLGPWFGSGLLHPCEPQGPVEMASYVSYATRVDDGEAMCLALAKCRSWTLATDERKGRRIAFADGIATLNTIELMKAWVRGTHAAADTVKEAIENIMTLGRYRPAADAPEVTWWRSNGGTVST